MATVPHEPSGVNAGRPQWTRLVVRDMWLSLAITAMWVAVAVDALFGPNIVISSGPGGSSSTVPSAIPVAGFAFLSNWIVARYGFYDDTKA